MNTDNIKFYYNIDINEMKEIIPKSECKIILDIFLLIRKILNMLYNLKSKEYFDNIVLFIDQIFAYYLYENAFGIIKLCYGNITFDNTNLNLFWVKFICFPLIIQIENLFCVMQYKKNELKMNQIYEIEIDEEFINTKIKNLIKLKYDIIILIISYLELYNDINNIDLKQRLSKFKDKINYIYNSK